MILSIIHNLFKNHKFFNFIFIFGIIVYIVVLYILLVPYKKYLRNYPRLLWYLLSFFVADLIVFIFNMYFKKKTVELENQLNNSLPLGVTTNELETSETVCIPSPKKQKKVQFAENTIIENLPETIEKEEVSIESILDIEMNSTLDKYKTPIKIEEGELTDESDSSDVESIVIENNSESDSVIENIVSETPLDSLEVAKTKINTTELLSVENPFLSMDTITENKLPVSVIEQLEQMETKKLLVLKKF